MNKLSEDMWRRNENERAEICSGLNFVKAHISVFIFMKKNSSERTYGGFHIE